MEWYLSYRFNLIVNCKNRLGLKTVEMVAYQCEKCTTGITIVKNPEVENLNFISTPFRRNGRVSM